MRRVGQEKPALEDVLEHFGVKGMQWGVRREQHRLNKATKAKEHASDNAKIEAARRRINSGQNKQMLRDAKTTFKSDKAEIGSRAARNKLNKVKMRVNSDAEIATLTKHGSETAGLVLGVVGSVLLVSALRSVVALPRI